MFRFTVIFVSSFIASCASEFIFGEGNIKFALIISCASVALLYFSAVLKNLSVIPKKGMTGRGCKYNLVSFNDAVANELMRIRSDLIDIKLKQEKLEVENLINIKKLQDKLECSSIPDDFLDKIPCDLLNNIPDDFLRIYRRYLDYPYNALCTYYQTPDGDSFGGKIIIVSDEINFDQGKHSEFDAEELREINSQKIHKFVKGMNLSVYIYEKNMYEPQIFFLNCDYFKQKAIILSIEIQDGHLFITLELDGVHFEDTIIRRIKIHNDYSWRFIPDKKAYLPC